MKADRHYRERFAQLADRTGFRQLGEREQAFLRDQAARYLFTLQELRQLAGMALELRAWDEGELSDIWPREPGYGSPRERKQRLLADLRVGWEALKASPNRYPADFPKPDPGKLHILAEPRKAIGLGRCPVASRRTRCCNLLTLDAVEGCGFDCSYCSIQSFYHQGRIRFDTGFREKLAALEIDPGRIYHIGTGQSSDSLMWGNRHGVLEALLELAREHPNVILELKTKSRNIGYLLRAPVPPNVICTWSLNTPTVIDNEEHLTAPVEERLTAARRLADRGILVGFHLHPMIHYHGWQAEYSKLFAAMRAAFDPATVALVSLGTLTFTRPVLKRIRGRDFKSKILRMPLIDAEGKFSYPEAIKLELFRHAYQGLEDWHDQVFFYLCMEQQRLWQPVFGHELPSNEALEEAMKTAYMAKIERLRAHRNTARPANQAFPNSR